MGSDIKKNPGSIPTDGTNESDIGSLRKKTLGDYLKAATRLKWLKMLVVYLILKILKAPKSSDTRSVPQDT